MNKPKVVIFIDWFIPAFKAGGPVKSVFNIIENFCQDVDFYVITSDRDFGDNSAYSNVLLNQWVKNENYLVIYLSPENQNTNFYSELIEQIKPNKVYFNSLFSSPFTLIPLKLMKSKFPKIEIILAPRGMLGQGALAIKKNKKKVFLTVSKMLGWFKGITWHASTEQERDEIKLHFGKNARVKIAENLGAIPKNIDRSNNKQKGRLSLLFVSRISTKKNLLFILECLNTTELKNNIDLSIVGPKEDEEYSKLCEDYAIKNGIDTKFLGGKTPEELKIIYSDHDLFILPTQHENYGHVIIEAMSFGTPVLLSKNTPWLNLESKQVGFDLDLNVNLFREKLVYFRDLTNDEWLVHSDAAMNFAKEQINNEQAIELNKSIFVQ